MRRYLLLIPALIFIFQIYWILQSKNTDTSEIAFDRLPEFSLPSLDIDGIMISNKDIEHQDIRMINFFASWCGPCKAEHPFLLELADNDVDILGIAFQDNKEQAINFLMTAKNPYLLTALDERASLGADWNIYSIPQTYLLSEDGRVIYHKSGRLLREDLDKYIYPLLKRN